MTKCPKCDGYSYKVEEIEPTGSSYKLIAVQCSSCNTPIGVMEYFNSGAKLANLERQVSSLAATVDQMSSNIQDIQYRVSNAR
jgi:hypothetical protein